MPVLERRNASILLGNTTATPIIYCRNDYKCFYCSEKHSEVNALIAHTVSHAVPDEEIMLKTHLPRGRRAIKVDISDLKCRICQKPHTNLDDIRNHLTVDHNKEFTKSGNGLVGFNLTTVNGQFACHLCSKKLPTFILLNRHMNVHFSNAVCETCGAGFMTHQRLKQHKLIHFPGGHPCTRCDKVYTTTANLQYHLEKFHEGTTKLRMLKCPRCPERFMEHFRKLKHLKEAHDITFSFECEVCKAVFPTRRSLTVHTNKFHSKKTQCEVCQLSFSSMSVLKNHRAAHTGEKNFVCSICQRSYRYQRGLKQHMKAHAQVEHFIEFNISEQKEYNATCSKCGSVFPNRTEFNRHSKECTPKKSKRYLK